MASNKYIFVNLTSHNSDFYDDCDFVDASYLNLLEMLYLISKLDIFIGIDSACGHIAAILMYLILHFGLRTALWYAGMKKSTGAFRI